MWMECLCLDIQKIIKMDFFSSTSVGDIRSIYFYLFNYSDAIIPCRFVAVVFFQSFSNKVHKRGEQAARLQAKQPKQRDKQHSEAAELHHGMFFL